MSFEGQQMQLERWVLAQSVAQYIDMVWIRCWTFPAPRKSFTVMKEYGKAQRTGAKCGDTSMTYVFLIVRTYAFVGLFVWGGWQGWGILLVL